MARTRLTIPDMSCGHCEGRIRTVLKDLDGVRGVEVELPAQAVEVDYDESRLTLERLWEVLAEEDYPVQNAQAL